MAQLVEVPAQLAQRKQAAAKALGSPAHRLVVLVMVVGLVRGLFWVFLGPVWNPVDETAHFAYVESLATAEGIPKVGEDLVSADILRSAKESPTYLFRTRPHGPEPGPAWAGTQHQYEGVQGPVYYLLMVPAYWLGRPFGILGALYAVRIASVVVAVLVVPLVWLLARELFPRSPAAWIAAPAVLVMVQGFNANLASVSNDGLVVVACTGTLVAAVRGLRQPTTRNALVTGALLGLSVVTKTTAVSLVPTIGIAWVVLVLRERLRRWQRIGWLTRMGAAAALVVAPWLVFNLVTYGALSAAQAVERITGNYQGIAPLSLHGLRQQWASATAGFWEFQPADLVGAEYRGYLWAALAASVALGVIGYAARRDLASGARIAWMGSVVPLTFISMILIVYGLSSGRGLLVGRYFFPVAAAIACGLAGGVVAFFGARVGPVALLALAAVVVQAEATVTRRYVEYTYAAGVLGKAVPIVDQNWAEDVTTATGIIAQAPCSVTAIGLGLEEEIPRVTVEAGARTDIAEYVGRDGDVSLFAIPGNVQGRLLVRFEREERLRIARTDRNPGTELLGEPGDPLARVYCVVPDPTATRFSQLYDPQHPTGLTYGRVLAWNAAWVWVARAALLAVVATVLLPTGRARWREHRMRRSSSR